MQDSVQSFVRALRAPTDPPRPGDPPKIEIASEAWCTKSFCVPRKAEIILEWCLTRLLKDATRDSGPNPVLDLRYWNLLHAVCLSVNSESSKMASIGSTWLRPLLNRVPLLPIVLSLLSNSLCLPAQRRDELYLQSSKSLAFLWSLAAPKFAPDALLDCFGAMLRVIEEAAASGEVSGLFEICGLVTSSLHTALSNILNKKKLSQAFVTSHMGVWLNLAAKGRATLSTICNEICDVGFELLFNADNLKQISDDPRSNPLFDTLRSHISSSPSHLLSALPILMAEFINAMKKRRTVFSTGDSFTVDAHSLVANFFSFCEDILRGLGLPQTQVWGSRLDLLNVMEDEPLFSPGDENTVALLKEEVEACVECLTSTDDANIQSAIQCLCVLSRIDHSFVESSSGRILSRFLTKPQSSGGTKPGQEFLSLTLSYHAKTRTLPVHISRLMDSCTVPPPHISSFPARLSYDELVASPILTTSHLDKLSKSVRTFITPGQTLDTATRVLVTLRDIWESIRGVENVSVVDREYHARKKRRTTGRSEKATEDVDAKSVTFVLAARIASTVLSSLPLHSATETVQKEVQAIVEGSLDGFVREAILAGANATVPGGTEGRDNVWAVQVVAAAALRLRYLLQLSVHARYSPGHQSEAEGLFAEVLVIEDRLPEYSVEIFRQLFYHGFRRTVEQQQALFEAVLNFLEVHLPALQSTPKVWSGRSSQLSGNDGSALAAVALLRLLLDRHLDIINMSASSAQQRRLVNLLHLARDEPKYEGAECGLSLATTVYECLHSANFWELENIRSSLFFVQQEKTAFLDSIDVAGGGKKPVIGQHVMDQIPEAVKVYTFLLHAPSECLPKSSRGDFVRRAVVLDFLLGSATIDSTYQALLTVRTFLFRTLNFLGSWEHETNGRYLRHLMTSPVPISTVWVTEELIQGHLLASFRAAVRGSTDKLLDAIQICREKTLEEWFLSEKSEAPLRSSTQRLMDIAMTEFSVSMFPPDVFSRLSSLLEHILDQLHPILRRLATSDVVEPDEITSYADMLLLWSCTIAFGKYLHRPKNPSPGLGTQIIQANGPLFLSQGSEDAGILKICSAMHAVLVSELQFYSAEEDSDRRESHLQRIITAYVVFAPLSMERRDFDENMASLLRSLSLSEFSSCLQFVFEALSAGETALEMMARLIRLASLAIHHAPQNTLKIVQAFVKECLDVFVSNAKLSDAHITRSSMLIFISDLCSKRPASLRMQNVMSIWVLLSRFLAGSKAHDTKTDTVLFCHIVSVLGALVRLRRDLIVTTLPHLSNIMRQLIFALRSPRPILGAKQYAIVADTLPAWINPSRPIGVEESKELSRLFTSLSAKTMVRVHGPSADNQKPESLARPLSKHVACVLQAYLDVLNDPLCVLATDIRRELQPGLFVLCDILNEHTRDALMVSALDVGGKAAMKGLWREYEKQRYTGKG